MMFLSILPNSSREIGCIAFVSGSRYSIPAAAALATTVKLGLDQPSCCIKQIKGVSKLL
ncbi:hypothetical protein [Sphingobacterium faecale]|uniref:Uncharacterized protein n=1 Tax=Sphingobacterium faecale TaxID=2803775 RepID=A0ABS1R505_9SPHI|nr:hypothetical protein [Sphingobacterium faecale]MBL1409590.1 hypothetical protein [Sphingobacterium faecale]